jgi:hypothetical protein
VDAAGPIRGRVLGRWAKCDAPVPSGLGFAAPVSRFFQLRLVASERTVKVELLRVERDRASEPSYPIKVTLLNISLSPFARLLIGATKDKRGRSQERSVEPECFFGGTGRIPVSRRTDPQGGIRLGEPT